MEKKPAKDWEIDAQIALEVATHEGLLTMAYKDSVGVWTWSVGLTNASGHDVERYIDKPSTVARALEVWLWALARYADDVRRAFGATELTKAQFAAALSFHWNTGAIGRATWVKQFKAGQVTKAKASFMNYKKPPEIVPRRRAERDLFFDGKWSGDGKINQYQRVRKPSYAPDWGSVKRIDIRPTVEKLIGGNAESQPTPVPTPKPVPPAEPQVPPPVEPTTPATGKGKGGILPFIILAVGAALAAVLGIAE